jgi:hypothetical protein
VKADIERLAREDVEVMDRCVVVDLRRIAVDVVR